MKKLPDSELDVMIQIWKSDTPICRLDIEDQLEEKQWASTTILTLLSRLEKKGFIKSQKEGKIKYYTPLIKEADYAAVESNSILKKFFGNSLKQFVVCMSSQDNFTDKELEELKEFLEEQKKTTSNTTTKKEKNKGED